MEQFEKQHKNYLATCSTIIKLNLERDFRKQHLIIFKIKQFFIMLLQELEKLWILLEEKYKYVFNDHKWKYEVPRRS